MTHRVLALVLLAALPACGGGRGAEAEAPVDPLAVARPEAEDHVALGVSADGETRVVYGPSEDQRRHGSRVRVWPRPFVAALRVVVAAEADWDRVRDGIDREIDREGTRLRVEVVEDGRVVDTFELPLRLTSLAPRLLEPPPLEVLLEPSPEGPRIAMRVDGEPWYDRFGCDAERFWTWRLGDGSLPVDAEPAVARLLEAWRDRDDLYARLAVEGDLAVPAAVPLGILGRLAALGVPRFDLDLQGGARGRATFGFVDRALHALARRQDEGGRWDEDDRVSWLVLGAFVGAGYTFRGRHPFAKVVSRALDGLLERPVPDPRVAALRTAVLVRLQAMTAAERLGETTRAALADLPARWREAPDDPLATAFAAMAVAYRTEVSPPVDLAFVDDLRAACRRLTAHGDDLALAAGGVGAALLGDEPEDASRRARLAGLVERLEGAPRPDPFLLWFAVSATLRCRGEPFKPWRDRWVKRLPYTPSDAPFPCGGGTWELGPESATSRDEATAVLTHALAIHYRYDRAFGAPPR